MGRQAHSECPSLEDVAGASSHPPLKGEGRIAEGDPGWGGGRGADDGDATYAKALSPPPGLLTGADLPPPGGGGYHRARTNNPSELHQRATGATFAANRAEGRVSLSLAATSLGMRRTTTREDGSLRVRFPAACAGSPEAVLVNTAGGVAGGDRFAVDLALEAGARLTVTTAAAEKIYRSLGPDACIDISAVLADGAELTWLPQETILFDRARLARTVDIALAPTAALLLAETIVFGRAAMGETVREGRFTDRWRVRRDGRLIFADTFQLDGPIADRLSEAAVAGGHRAIGTVLMAPGDDAAVAAVRTASGQFRGEVGISNWNVSSQSSIMLSRLAAPDGAALRHDLVVLLSALGRRALPRIWLN